MATIQLTDGGPSVILESATGVAGPPLGGAPGVSLHSCAFAKARHDES